MAFKEKWSLYAVLIIHGSNISPVYTGPLIRIRITVHVNAIDPDSDHLLYVDHNPDLNPGSRVNAAIVNHKCSVDHVALGLGG